MDTVRTAIVLRTGYVSVTSVMVFKKKFRPHLILFGATDV